MGEEWEAMGGMNGTGWKGWAGKGGVVRPREGAACAAQDEGGNHKKRSKRVVFAVENIDRSSMEWNGPGRGGEGESVSARAHASLHPPHQKQGILAAKGRRAPHLAQVVEQLAWPPRRSWHATRRHQRARGMPRRRAPRRAWCASAGACVYVCVREAWVRGGGDEGRQAGDGRLLARMSECVVGGTRAGRLGTDVCWRA
eukprot:350782-Chlamydomonas_euryale.AAC.2